MPTCPSTGTLTPADGYKVWAASYDRERNPMLSLEQRILERLLPPFTGLDVVDLGCGTGRWLTVAKAGGARSLVGVDPSLEMLSCARAKLGKPVKLVCSDYAGALIANDSADIVLCNFALSYIESAKEFLNFVHRILRPGGSLFLTDIHPETSEALGWKRGLRIGNEFQAIRTYDRGIKELLKHCERSQFEQVLLLEPKFGEAERAIFAESGKHQYFDEIREYPAIYLLQVRAGKPVQATSYDKNVPGIVDRICGGRVALGPTDSLAADLSLCGGYVERMDGLAARDAESQHETAVELRGCLIFPGFINVHDHLEFALFPRLGKGGYRSFLEWADDIHSSHADEIARHRGVPKRVRLWWGGIRNLLCGVTTVCHHNPYDPEMFDDNFPVRVLREFEWAHSLALDSKAVFKRKVGDRGKPFFLHLAEGIDDASAGEIFQLQQDGALDENTVIIHGVGLRAKGKGLLRKSGAALVWCPSSNLFLFGSTVSAEEMQGLKNVALGSDSPLTAHGDLLDEVRCALQELDARPTDLYDYITRGAANLLRMQNVGGSFRVGATADLVAVSDGGRSPAETLVSCSYEDIELVIKGGRVQLMSTEMKDRLPQSVCEGLQPLLIEETLRWIRAPLEWLFAETTALLGEDIYLGGRAIRPGN